MIYFKYKISFKKAKNLDNLIKNQGIVRIFNQDEFKKHQLNGDDIYCFINPYCSEINGELVLDWKLSEELAMENFYRSKEEI